MPDLAMNIAVAVLLIRVLHKDVGLSPSLALVSSLFFVLPPVVTSSKLFEAAGGDIEPVLCVLLLWILRDRPVLFGVIASIGFATREFTIYAVFAILFLECCRGGLLSKASIRSRALSLAVMAAGTGTIGWLKHHSALLGPGSSGAATTALLNAHGGLGEHLAWNPSALGSNFKWLFTENLATLFGYHTELFRQYMESRLVGGHPSVLILLVMLLVIAALCLVRQSRRHRLVQRAASTLLPPSWFPAYLMLTGIQAALVYALFSAQVQDISLTRYTLLTIFLPIGISAWIFRTERSAAIRAVAITCILLWAAAQASDSGRLLSEYLRHPPADEYRELTNFLEERGVKYGRASYWDAYAVDFLSNERIILASNDFVRINEYGSIVDQHREQAVTITATDREHPCDATATQYLRWCIAAPR